MGTLFEDIRDGIRDGIELVVDKTEEYTKIGKIQIDILGIKRKIEKHFSELGGRTYELLAGATKKSVNTDAEVKVLIEELKKLEAELDAKKDEIKGVKAEKNKERKERGETRQKDQKEKADEE